MAITASGMYLTTFLNIFDATQLTFDYIGDTVNNQLIQVAATPDFDAHDARPDLTNEPGNSGSYSSGGDTLGTKTMVIAAGGLIRYDAADEQYTSATITARACVQWDDTTTGPADALLCLLDFGSDITSTSGNFDIAYGSNGFIEFDLVP